MQQRLPGHIDYPHFNNPTYTALEYYGSYNYVLGSLGHYKLHGWQPQSGMVLALLLMFFPSKSASRYKSPTPKPMEHCPSQYGYQQVLNVSYAKMRKSFRCWSLAFIQQQWYNA